MNRIKTSLLFLCLCLSLGISLAAQLTAHAAQDKKTAATGDAKRGEGLFAESCKQCHKTDSKETVVGPGLQGLFKDKKKLENGKPVNEANVKDQIKKGGNGMPPYADKYKANQLDDLVAYLKTL